MEGNILEIKKKNKKKKKEKSFLNVFGRAYKGYSFFHPKNLRGFFSNWECAYLRATKGYCYRDRFEISGWFIETMSGLLNDMADHHYGWPEYIGGHGQPLKKITNEEWEEMLREIALHIKNASEDECPEKNEYWDEYHKLRTITCEKNENGFHVVKFNESEEAQQLWQKVSQRDKEIWDYRQKEIETALDMLKPIFFNLWD